MTMSFPQMHALASQGHPVGRRWPASLKFVLVSAHRQKDRRVDLVIDVNSISPLELNDMDVAVYEHGLDGLKITRLTAFRRKRNRRRQPTVLQPQTSA